MEVNNESHLECLRFLVYPAETVIVTVAKINAEQSVPLLDIPILIQLYVHARSFILVVSLLCSHKFNGSGHV